MDRPPFTTTREQEERDQDKSRVLSIRLNQDDLLILEHYKDLLDTENDGRVLKILIRAGHKVIQADLGDETLRWMARRGRARVLGIRESPGS